MRGTNPRRRSIFVVLSAIAMVFTLLPTAAGAQDDLVSDRDEHSIVTLVIPDQDTMMAVVDGGFDLDHNMEPVGDGYSVTAIVTAEEAAALADLGVDIDVEMTPAELAAHHETLLAEMNATIAEEQALAAELGVEQIDTVIIARADTFTNTNGSRSLSVEAKNIAGTSGVTMTLSWFDADDNLIGSTTMGGFTDAGQYMYHRQQVNNLAVYPERVTVTSNNGGSAERDVEDWLGPIGPGPAHRYFTGFLDRYHNSHEYRQMILDLHEQFPEITEIVDLPYLTNGYRRNAMALIGSTANGSANRVGVTSHAWGHEGGNDLTLEFRNPGAPDAPLTVSVTGNAILVTLATDAAGALTSTAAQVAAAIDASPAAAALVNAYTYRTSTGAGIVAASAPVALTDDLQAPASVPRAPFQVKALRIGKHRDGSRTGVLMYSQEHAREWQTPLVQIETANRLLHNYYSDHKTKQLVDNLDIFIIPTINPDGSLYSTYDFGSQRRNMTNHCVEGGSIDFAARDGWGVDNNRNYSANSGFDGYSGASTSCTSDTYRGPAELSEPESANVAWIAGAFPNIKFSMNVHSSGNYYMWAPGSYITPGRIPAPRPSFGSENYFFEMADNILTGIKQHRGLTVTPARTGPIADVLYSAAGNSADMLWYDYGIFGFSFEVGTSFQPSFASGVGSEAWQQMMEFSNGQVELLVEALTWTRDRYAPTSWIEQDVSAPSAAPVGITFNSSEPVDIYYTTDGSNPTTESTQYLRAGIREAGETLWFTETTTIKWFSVDMAGNVEGKYDPRRSNARSATITITP